MAKARVSSARWNLKEAYGEKGGTIIHVISYTVVPIIIGVACIIACFLGVDVF